MKTEQEQIKEIADVLCDYCKNNTKIGEPCKSSNGTYICTSEIRRATAIMQAGYGDVSEYKAEIERLNIREEHYKLICDVTKATKKQAQIDVLNKLKTNLSKSDDFMDICSWHIDKLIKEIEQ